jgi:restriction system protein
MAEKRIRREGELMRGVFKLLLEYPDGLPVRTILEKLPKIVPPKEEEKAPYPGNPDVPRYETIVRFATIAPVKAGWLQLERGLWTLTEEGRKAYERFSDPEVFMQEAGKYYREWAKARTTPGNGPSSTVNYQRAVEAAWAEIEARLQGMSPYDLQNLVAGLLRAMGYHVAWVAPPGPDGGVDIVAHGDPLGVQGPRIKVQVKRLSDKVPAQGIRSFLALLGDNDVGLFMCTGGFTREAEEEARRQEKRRIMLVDSRRFFDLWVEYYQHIPEDSRRLLSLRPVYFFVPEDESV